MRVGWNGMDLSIEQKKKFVEFINGKWPEPQACPICKEQSWVNADSVYEIREAKPKNIKNVLFTPMIQIICANCGYTLLFNAIIAGIYVKDNAKDSHEAGSTPSKDSVGEK